MWSVHAFSARQTAILNHIPSSLPFCTGIQFSCDAIDHTIMLEDSPVNSLLDQAASHPTSLLSQSASEPASKSVQQKQRQQPMLHLI